MKSKPLLAEKDLDISAETLPLFMPGLEVARDSAGKQGATVRGALPGGNGIRGTGLRRQDDGS
jgi:hypothetical protein